MFIKPIALLATSFLVISCLQFKSSAQTASNPMTFGYVCDLTNSTELPCEDMDNGFLLSQTLSKKILTQGRQLAIVKL